MRSPLVSAVVLVLAGCASSEPAPERPAPSPPPAPRPAASPSPSGIVIKGHKDDARPTEERSDAARIAELEARARASQGRDNGQGLRAGPVKGGTGVGPPSFAGPCVGFGCFTIAGHRYDAGTVSALATNGSTYLVTAFHIFEQEKSPLPPGELPDQLRVTDAESDTVLASGGPPLLIASAASLSTAGVAPARDLAAFPLLEGRLTTLTLASKDPVAGESVWLICRFQDQTGPATLHPAVVVSVDANELVYKSVSTSGAMSGTSGAPIVNAAGEVVGLHLSHGNAQDGSEVWIANPRAAVAKAIASRS